MIFVLLFSFLKFYHQKEVSLSRGYLDTWNIYKRAHDLIFDEDENKKRLSIFLKNLEYIRRHNSQNSEYTLKLNHMAHLEEHEVGRCLILKDNFVENPKSLNKPIGEHLPVPQFVDWRQKGYVSEVKNQGKCGSCYAFSAISAVESHIAINMGKMVELSEQEIVDCSDANENKGCRGGLPDNAFDYIQQNGISYDRDYPYTGQEGYCFARRKRHMFRVLSHVDVPSGDEEALIRAIAFNGPVSIAVDANSLSFRFYSGGILDPKNCSSIDLNHAVLAVGYNLKDFPYLIIKNSWGLNWGEDGYVRIPLFENNKCGIATFSSYPIIDLLYTDE